MEKNKFISKIAFNTFAISTTLLVGYILSDNDSFTKESVALATTSFTSGVTLAKIKWKFSHN